MPVSISACASICHGMTSASRRAPGWASIHRARTLYPHTLPWSAYRDWEIDYDGGEKGWLLYIKSSLTGDENDYVRDYARRYDQFPHEPTGDQFFSEEQFEVYRALGFHITNRLLNGDDTCRWSVRRLTSNCICACPPGHELGP